MKLFKDDYGLIFKYYNVSEDSNINLNNLNLNNNINSNSKHNSPEIQSKQAPKQKELYFTIDEIEKGKLIFNFLILFKMI
jgi:hypothetical protein